MPPDINVAPPTAPVRRDGHHMRDSFSVLSAADAELVTLRAELRRFLDADRAAYGWRPAVDAWLAGWDGGFSARLGEAGFVGLTIPCEYGGQGLGHLHRFVVTEELLIWGAPVAAHWFADRQVAPALLAHGTEEQRRRFLPEIAAGRLFTAIGMSEPHAGSDLAAATTRAIRCDGGWVLNGRKIWTSGAHRAHQIVVLARTSALDPHQRHAGFSQFIIPADAEGVTIEPILLMDGEHHFNEVLLTDVFVPDTDVLGRIGNGWHQVTAELAYERSGPERVLSTAPMILALLSALDTCRVDDHAAARLGDLLARMVSLRQLSVSVAQTLARGGSAANEAALIKDLGTRFEQDSVQLVSELLDAVDPAAPERDQLAALLLDARLHAPLFTLRGGTNEVLRGLVARGMGLR